MNAYFVAKVPVRREWKRMMVSSRSQMNTRSTWVQLQLRSLSNKKKDFKFPTIKSVQLKNLSLEVWRAAVPPFYPSPRARRAFSTRWLQDVRVEGAGRVGQGGRRGDRGELSSSGCKETKMCAKKIRRV